MKRNLSLLLGLLLMVAFVFEGNAAFHDPAIKWRTIKTEHFKIHYNEDVEFAAKRVAIIAEEVHQSLTKKMEWKPWGKTEVVISDGFDTGNGWGTVVPYNWITLYVGSPLPDSSLAQYDDWLRMLVAHEYTHILHLDMARGIWRALKYMIGKVSAPNALTPGWIKEGEAVYNETRETHSGRIRGTYDQMIIRTAILQNKFPRIDQVDGTGWKWPGYGSMYIYGAQFIDHLADKYGEKKLIEFNKRTAATPLLHSINRQAKKTFGKTFYVLWKDWQKTLEMKYGEEKEKIESTKLTELDVVVQGEEEYYSLPTFSSDGRWLAYVNYSAHHAGYLYLKDLKTNEIKKIGEGRETLEGEDEIPDQEFRKSSKVRGVSQITFSPDGKKIMYSMLGSYKRYYDYFSIYEYDIEKSKTKTVIYGKRGRDPDISPDGKKIVYVRNSPKGNSLWLHELKDKDKGEDEDKEISEKVSFYVIPAEAGIQKLLKRLDPRIREDDRQTVFQRFHKDKNKDESKDKDKKEVAKVDEEKDKMILDDKELFIQYNNPRWSPDGGYIAFSSHRGFQRDLYLFSVKNKKLTRITNDKALDLRPWWNQRSKELYFSSDRTGISNIYKYNLNTKKLVRVTNVLTGVFEPAVTADGKDLYVKYYDGNGYDIRKVKKTISIDAKNDKKFNFSQFDKGLTEKYSQIKITDERLDREVKIVNRKTKKSKKIEKDAPQTVDQSKPAKKEYESKKYSPFGMGMLPRSLVPGFLILDDALMFSAVVNGNDPLLHH
ncbi:hypothetical protein KKA47_04990, partial [bacterium]|nr:hypothetical protein [bacterium]